jgi:octaprenyl-diphosphate synthase
VETQELMDFFRAAAAGVDQAMQADLAAVENPSLAEILQHAVFNGGKRIRPQLTLLCCALTTGGGIPDPDSTMKLAMVFEYLHAASLLHDDVIDRAELRRGKPAANVVWGIPSVILAGDYLHSRAMTLAGENGGPEAVAVAGRAVSAMIESEFLQMKNAESLDPSEEKYFRVASGKTGALIAAACEAGVLKGGGSDEQRQAVRLYGENIGLAFQIVDDLLDYQGDPEKTGKAVGNDLAEGKMTLPLIHALRQATDEDRQTLEKIIATEAAARPQHFAEVKSLIDKAGGFASAGKQAAELVKTGLEKLSSSFKEGKELQILAGLAGYVLSRDK